VVRVGRQRAKPTGSWRSRVAGGFGKRPRPFGHNLGGCRRLRRPAAWPTTAARAALMWRTTWGTHPPTICSRRSAPLESVTQVLASKPRVTAPARLVAAGGCATRIALRGACKAMLSQAGRAHRSKPLPAAMGMVDTKAPNRHKQRDHAGAFGGRRVFVVARPFPILPACGVGRTQIPQQHSYQIARSRSGPSA
jgi:hypothetical protein